MSAFEIDCPEDPVQSFKDTILRDIQVYLHAHTSTDGNSHQPFFMAFKQLVQKLTDTQAALETILSPTVDVKPSVADLENYKEKYAVERSHQQDSEDKHFVQILADRTQMDKRIAAFQARKRKELDDLNVQEFCGHQMMDEDDPAWDQKFSCARVDAIFVARMGSKSHVKVSKVNNILGPQVQVLNGTPVNVKTETVSDDISQVENDSINERLKNMESHLKLKSDSFLRTNIFARLKHLENRLLYLEGCCPEYINISFLGTNMCSPEKQMKTVEPGFHTSNTSRIYKRMQTLREELKWKSRKMAGENP